MEETSSIFRRPADISSMEYILFLMNRNVTYSIRIAPEDYDYESLDLSASYSTKVHLTT